MELLSESFWDRANGDSDRYGNYWEPLKESTLQIKSAILERLISGETDGEAYESEYAQILSKNYKRSKKKKPPNTGEIYDVEYMRQAQNKYKYSTQLNFSDRKKYERKFEQIKKKRSPTAKEQRSALNEFNTGKVNYDAVELINVRSGDLAEAFGALNVTRGRLYKVSARDRVGSVFKAFTWKDDNVHLSFELDFSFIEYAERVDDVRKLIPENIQELEADVEDHALTEAAKVFYSIYEKDQKQ